MKKGWILNTFVLPYNYKLWYKFISMHWLIKCCSKKIKIIINCDQIMCSCDQLRKLVAKEWPVGRMSLEPWHEPFVNLFAHLREGQDSQANVIWLWVCCCLLQIIKKLIERKQNQIRKVYPGLTCFKEGVRQIPVESIPGISKCALVS